MILQIKKIIWLFFISLLPITNIFSFVISDSTKQETTEIIPGKEYEAGWLHRLLFGSLWRDLWTTPINIEVLNLDTTAGGLKPTGVHQANTLKLKGNNGKEYRFRLFNKDFTKIFPEKIRQSFAAHVLNDQLSASNPAAALIAAPIVNAAGMFLAQPHLYLMPDDEKLGEFRKFFGGKPGIFEVHPYEKNNQSDSEVSKKIINTFTLFEILEEDNNNIVDASEYLKTRLIDIFLGDWDRHVDQWNWAVLEENDFKTWYPVPEQRDQAFSRYDGLFPFAVSIVIQNLRGFSDEYGSIEDLTYSGRFIDRRFLISLNKAEWDSVTNFLINRLTDSVIINAVKQMPPEMFEKEGAQLISDLISRRNNLKDASDKFYLNLAEYVNIRGSNKDEYAEVIRLNDNQTEVTLYKKDGDTGKIENKIFHRIFDSDETCEIRILLMDGNDDCVIKGNADSGIDVIVSSGKGKNSLTDSSLIKGSFLGIIPNAENKTKFFITNKDDKIIKSAGTKVYKENITEINDQQKKYEPENPDYGVQWGWIPVFNISSDEGLVIGGGRTITKFGYNSLPYVYRMELSAAYAVKPSRIRADFSVRTFSMFKNLIFNFDFSVSGIDVLNFYGFGNETMRIDSLHQADYYDVNQQQFTIMPYLEIPTGVHAGFKFGTALKYVQTEKENNKLITSLQPYGIKDITFQNFFAGFIYDSRNGRIAPTSGTYFNLTAAYHPAYLRAKYPFTKIKALAKTYIEFDFALLSSLALKAGGEKIWGTFPYSESSLLGGDETLRGFENDRFAGDASFYTGADLRIYLTQINFIIPAKLGFNTFAETGRVFLKNEKSKLWHKTFGGGVLIALIKEDYTFNLTAAFSEEDVQYGLSTGFAF